MSEEQVRRDFEAWARNMALSLEREPFPDSRTYATQATFYAWHGYRASSTLYQSQVRELREALQFIVDREDFTFAECSLAEAIVDRARAALSSTKEEQQPNAGKACCGFPVGGPCPGCPDVSGVDGKVGEPCDCTRQALTCDGLGRCTDGVVDLREPLQQLVASLRQYGSFPPDVLPALRAAEHALNASGASSPWPFTGCSGPLTDCDMDEAGTDGAAPAHAPRWVPATERLPAAPLEDVLVIMTARGVGNPRHPGFGTDHWIRRTTFDGAHFMCVVLETGSVAYWLDASSPATPSSEADK